MAHIINNGIYKSTTLFLIFYQSKEPDLLSFIVFVIEGVNCLEQQNSLFQL